MADEIHPGHIACIFGGGIAGSEAAAHLAEQGVYSVVFEMANLPWGKIEWGLPKWHAKQRDQEEARIDENLDNPYVTYVPGVRLGVDLRLDEIQNWGFSVVLLAVGAWRDRPLGIPGIEALERHGFYYQNPFVSWFNEYHSPEYEGPEYEIHDNALVVGGGLASLDVVKILMLETTMRALRKRGLRPDLFELEKKGIPRTLQKMGISWKDLGLKGCTLLYRRRARDMPLIPLDDDPSPERLQKAEKVREKLLANFRSKYLFRFQPRHVAVDSIVEGNRLVGLTLQETEIEGRRVKPVPGSEREVRSPLVISSIGSIPEPIPGIEMERELFPLENQQTGRLSGYDNVFALGNAVTGRGNIRASRLHGREVSRWITEHFLGWSQGDWAKARQGGMAPSDPAKSRAPVKTEQEIESIRRKARRLASDVGYDGNYAKWIQRHRPIRLEDIQES